MHDCFGHGFYPVLKKGELVIEFLEGAWIAIREDEIGYIVWNMVRNDCVCCDYEKCRCWQRADFYVVCFAKVKSTIYLWRVFEEKRVPVIQLVELLLSDVFAHVELERPPEYALCHIAKPRHM